MDSKMNTTLVPLVGRILLGLIFVLSGFSKLGNPSGTIAYIAHTGLPMPPLAYAVSLLVELGGGLLLVFGLLTRWVALALALFCLVTAFAVHGFADQNNMIHAMKNISMAGGFIYVAGYGAGLWSLDALLSRRRGLSVQHA